MLTLCGFSSSNYYNKAKLALLEKGVPFQEELAWVGETDRAASPLGKVPYLKTEHGPISESAVICEYVEAVHPQPPLLPAEPFAAAKVRELLVFLELHLELAARNVYAEAFFGGKVSDGVKTHTHKLLLKNLKGFANLAAFDKPFIAGAHFTLADCAAITHLPVVSNAAKIIYGADLVAEHLPGAREYLKRMGERPHVQTVNADRKAGNEAFMAHIRELAQAAQAARATAAAKA